MQVTVYYEELAKNAKLARKKVKKHFRNGIVSSGNQVEAFKGEAKTELQDHYFIGGKVRVWPSESAGLYHSAAECKLCTKAQKRKGAK